MTLVCMHHGIGDSLINPIHGCGVITYLTLIYESWDEITQTCVIILARSLTFLK